MADPDDDFATLFEQSVATGSAAAPRPRSKQLEAGQVVRGTIVAIGDDTVFVDVGTKSEARLDRSAVTNAKGELTVAVGDTLEATVADAGHRGPPRLVLAYGGGGLDVRALELAAAGGTPVEGVIRKAVKAGLEVELGTGSGTVRAFCPASHVELGYVADLSVYEGQNHFFKVLEVRDGGRSVVVSRKALLQAQREAQAAEVATQLAVGQELDGIVQSIQPYGAFVDLGGLQGLLHVSEMAHGRVASPSDVVSVGESVRVQVTAIEHGASGKPQDMRVSLSMKAMVQPGPTEGTTPDEVITATVVKVESFGVLVDTPAGQGLVPNGELALPPGSDPRRAYGEGDTFDVVLQQRDASRGRLRFSAKAVEEVEARRNFRQFRDGQRGNRGLGSLADLLQGIQVPDGPPAKAPAPARQAPPAKAQVAAATPPPSEAAAPKAPSEDEPARPRRTGRRRRV